MYYVHCGAAFNFGQLYSQYVSDYIVSVCFEKCIVLCQMYTLMLLYRMHAYLTVQTACVLTYIT